MEYPARTTINQHILLLRMASLMASTSTDPTGVPVSASELCSSSISSTNPRFASGDVQDRMARKRKTTVNTWAHAREPLISEPSRCGRKNEKIYYCMYCASLTYSTTVSTTFRNHLLKKEDRRYRRSLRETALERRERGDCILVPNTSRSVIHKGSGPSGETFGPALFPKSQNQSVAQDSVERALDIHRDQRGHLLASKCLLNVVNYGGYEVCRRPLRKRSSLLRVKDSMVNACPRETARD
jgi:hypothetical protein